MTPAPRPTIADIIHAVGEYTRIPTWELVERGRRADVARARQLVMWLATQRYRYSQPMVGRALGGRDHTTVIHGTRRIENEMRREDVLLSQGRFVMAPLRRVADEVARLAEQRTPVAPYPRAQVPSESECGDMFVRMGAMLCVA